jgi:hypothetical protein
LKRERKFKQHGLRIGVDDDDRHTVFVGFVLGSRGLEAGFVLEDGEVGNAGCGLGSEAEGRLTLLEIRRLAGKGGVVSRCVVVVAGSNTAHGC